MRFLTDIKRSVSDPSFYGEAVRRPLWPSIFHLYGLLVIVSFLSVLIWIVQGSVAMPKVRDAIRTFETEGRDVYPAELIVTVTGGTLSTNVKEPYAIDLPTAWKSLNGRKGHFLTIDTKSSLAEYARSDSLILVTKDALIYPDNRYSSNLKVTLLEKSMDIVLTREKVDTLYESILPYVKLIPVFLALISTLGLLVLPFFFALFSTVGNLVYLTIIALLLFVIVHLAGRKFPFGAVFRVALFSFPAPLACSLFGTAFPQYSVSYLFSIILLAWSLVILWKLPPPPGE